MSKRYEILLKQAERAIFEAAKERGWEQARLGRPIMKPQDAIADVLRTIATQSGCERRSIFRSIFVSYAREDGPKARKLEKWFKTKFIYRDIRLWPYTDVPPGLIRPG
jgi:hypothetical protein